MNPAQREFDSQNGSIYRKKEQVGESCYYREVLGWVFSNSKTQRKPEGFSQTRKTPIQNPKVEKISNPFGKDHWT